MTGSRDTLEPHAATAARWANRLERAPWRWLTSRWPWVTLAVVLVLLFAVAQWWRYGQMTSSADPVLECHSTEGAEDHEVRWQWMPPGFVCVYPDGRTQYIGP